MNTKIIEGSLILITVVKWFFLAICVGVIVGLSTTAFLKTLDWGIKFVQQFGNYFWYLPLALPLSALLIDRYAPEAEGYGARVIEAIHKYSGKISPMVAPVKFAASVLTISFGGSAGKTGPCVQIGAGLASIFASLIKLPESERKKLVICGISAAFSTVFGTTIAGAIFGSEVLYIGALFYEMLFPSFIAGLVAHQTAVYLGLSYSAFPFPMYTFPGFSGLFFGKIFLSGIFFGLCALLLIESLNIGEKISQNIPVWNPLKGVIGGILLILLSYVISEEYLGLGIQTIHFCLLGQPVSSFSFLAKILFVTITLNFCGSGGILTPILFVGATAGNVFARFTGSDLPLFSTIGMVSMLAGSANTPLTAIIMASELFSPQIAMYAAVACITSFLMAGHHSVYPSQVMLFAKSAALDVETQKEVREIHDIHISTQRLGLIGILVDFFRK